MLIEVDEITDQFLLSLKKPIQKFKKLARKEKIWLKLLKRKPTRSESQREYYYAVIIAILMDELGWDNKDQVNEELKWEFNRKPLIDPRTGFQKYNEHGLPIYYPGSIEGEDTKTCERIFQAIRIWASTEHGIFIPLPNEDIT